MSDQTSTHAEHHAAADGHLMDHEYDGIREFDNPTPGWWHVLFLTFIVFGVFYVFVAHFSPMYWTPEMKLEAAKTAKFKMLFADVGELEPDRQTLLSIMDDVDEETGEKKWVGLASSLYAGNCSSCHAAGGAGMVGPNLTDDHWRNVEKVEDIYDILYNGAGNGAMPNWNNRLGNNELVLLSAYIASLRGSDPPGGLAPDGTEIAPWPEVDAASDLSGGDTGQ